MPSFLHVPYDIDRINDAELITFTDQIHFLDIASESLMNESKRSLTTLNLYQTEEKIWEIIYIVENDDAQPNKLAQQWFPFTKINGSIIVIEGNASIICQPKSIETENPEEAQAQAQTQKPEDQVIDEEEITEEEITEEELNNPNNYKIHCDICEIDKSVLTSLLEPIATGTLVYTNGTTCDWPCDKPFGNVKKFIDRFLSLGYMLFVYWNENSEESVNTISSEIYGSEIKGDALFTLQVDEHMVSISKSELLDLYELSDKTVSITDVEAFQILNENEVKNRFQAVILEKLKHQYSTSMNNVSVSQ